MNLGNNANRRFKGASNGKPKERKRRNAVITTCQNEVWGTKADVTYCGRPSYKLGGKCNAWVGRVTGSVRTFGQRYGQRDSAGSGWAPPGALRAGRLTKPRWARQPRNLPDTRPGLVKSIRQIDVTTSRGLPVASDEARHQVGVVKYPVDAERVDFPAVTAKSERFI